MGKFVGGLVVFIALMAATLDQDRTLTWLDNWLAVPTAMTQQTLKLPPTAELTSYAKPPAYSAPPARTSERKRDTVLDNLAAAYKRQFKVVDGRLAVVELHAKNGVPNSLHYRLPQTNVLGGEVQGEISQKSATVAVHWPRKD